jgi:hypothetical protein
MYGAAWSVGFVEWWENDPATNYGPDYLRDHPGPGPNGHDSVTELILEKAKLEFKAGTERHRWEMKRASNMMEWRRCIRLNLDMSKCRSEEDHLVCCRGCLCRTDYCCIEQIFEIKNAKMLESLAWKERRLVGRNVIALCERRTLDTERLMADLVVCWRVLHQPRHKAVAARR